MNTSGGPALISDEELFQAGAGAWPTHQLKDQAFCSPKSLRAWAQAFLPGRGWSGPLSHVVSREHGAIQAFVPFAKQKIALFSIHSLAGYYWPFRTLFVAAQQAPGLAAAEALGRELAAHPPGAVLRFGPVSSRDAALHTVLRELSHQGWRSLCRETGAVFELDLSQGMEGLKPKFSNSLIKNIEYSRRRLGKTVGELSVERHVMGRSLDILDTLAGIESQSWLAKKGGELKFIGAANQRFWALMGEQADGHSEAVFWVLRCGGQPLAFSAHLETETAVYIIANSYDEQWKSHSPGSILTFDVLQDAVARGKLLLDWGQGDSGYKQRWGAQEASLLHDVMMFKPGLIGGLLAWVARKALPSWTVRLDSLA